MASKEEREIGNERLGFITTWLTSLISSIILFLYVTQIIGYSSIYGVLYFTGFFISLILIHYIMGCPLYPGQKPFNLDD